MENKRREELLAILKKEQKAKGGLTREVLEDIARSTNLPLGEVFGVASFYSFLNTHPVGKYVIRVCTNLPCYYKNSQMVIETIEKELGIKPGETTADGKFSLELTNCIGACDRPPSMMINNKIYGNLSPEKVRKILSECD